VVYYTKAKGYFDVLEDKKNADEVLQKIELVKAHNNKTCETYGCLVNRGKIQMGEKNYDDAVKYFEEAEKKARTNSEKAGAIAKSGIAYFLEGEEKEALSKFNTLKSEYARDYKKSKDRHRIDLFMGASIILTAKDPDKMLTKLNDKLKGIWPGKKEGGATFAENINSARNLLLSAIGDIGENTTPAFVQEAAVVCERVAERFEDWDRVGDARQFYEEAIGCYKQLLNNEKVVALNKKLREME
jgi:tetratricopeptide (TPR) repeat protein